PNGQPCASKPGTSAVLTPGAVIANCVAAAGWLLDFPTPTKTRPIASTTRTASRHTLRPPTVSRTLIMSLLCHVDGARRAVRQLTVVHPPNRAYTSDKLRQTHANGHHQVEPLLAQQPG